MPYAGPVISFTTAFLMVLVSPDTSMSALITICILYVIFQQIEGNILAPMVMSKTMNLSALYILLMTFAGATLGGIP
ncbi:MAG: AI-2E family transporter [bacterium]